MGTRILASNTHTHTHTQTQACIHTTYMHPPHTHTHSFREKNLSVLFESEENIQYPLIFLYLFRFPFVLFFNHLQNGWASFSKCKVQSALCMYRFRVC